MEADHFHLRIGHGRANSVALPPIEVGIIHRRAGVPALRRSVPEQGRDGGQHVAGDVLAAIDRAVE